MLNLYFIIWNINNQLFKGLPFFLFILHLWYDKVETLPLVDDLVKFISLKSDIYSKGVKLWKL